LGIGNADVVKLRGRAIKQGLLSALSAFLLHKTRDTPSRVNREVSKSLDRNSWHIYQGRVKNLEQGRKWERGFSD
jgi:hypothetical protein